MCQFVSKCGRAMQTHHLILPVVAGKEAPSVPAWLGHGDNLGKLGVLQSISGIRLDDEIS